MKKKLKFLVFTLLCFMVINMVAVAKDEDCNGDIIKRLDPIQSQSMELPKRFRVDNDLNISGSAQFTKGEIINIKKALENKKILDVDLRQESHGLINDIAFNYHKVNGVINKGFSSEEVMVAEKELLSKIKIGDVVTICKGPSVPKLTLNVKYVSNEEEAVKKEEIDYKRFAVRDGDIPTPQIVDDFVHLVKNKDEKTHIHFHCEAGEGRTTTFMVMYSTMKNYDKKSLDNIVLEQVNLGGIEIRDIPKRAEFITHFYNYCKANGGSGFKMSYRDYLKENNLSY